MQHEYMASLDLSLTPKTSHYVFVIVCESKMKRTVKQFWSQVLEVRDTVNVCFKIFL